MIRFIVVVIVSSVTLLSLSSSESLTGLKFHDDFDRTPSVVVFRPDMSQYTEKLSFCVWIKNLLDHGWSSPTPFSYHRSLPLPSLYIFADRYRSYIKYSMFDKKGYIREDKFLTPNGAWVQWCGTWSLESRQFRVYINGTLAGQLTTPPGPWEEHKFIPEGTWVLGDYWDTTRRQATGMNFGGEMFGFNLFAKELTGEEIAELSTDGLCTDTPESLETYRLIRWEDILEFPRSENIQNIEIQCKETSSELPVEEIEPASEEEEVSEREHDETADADFERIKLELNVTKLKLIETELKLNETEIELESKKVELEGTKADLQSTKEELNETRNELERTEQRLVDVELQLDEPCRERPLNCSLTKGLLSKWDILYSRDFYNQIFTRQQHNKLRNVCRSLDTERLLGMEISDKFITLIKDMDEADTCS